MSQQDLMKLKESFAHEIFKQDLLTTYQEQTVQRNLLKKETTDLVRSIVHSINKNTYEKEAAQKIAEKLKQQNIECEILVPVGKDWNEDLTI
jgi:hypothetical protein